jgi:hypothetical protein
MFSVGERVVCVNDSPPGPHFIQDFEHWITRGTVYTIRSVSQVMGMQRVLLEEVRNPPVFITGILGKAEPGFAAERFRPLEPLAVTVETESEKQSEPARTTRPLPVVNPSLN